MEPSIIGGGHPRRATTIRDTMYTDATFSRFVGVAQAAVAAHHEVQAHVALGRHQHAPATTHVAYGERCHLDPERCEQPIEQHARALEHTAARSAKPVGSARQAARFARANQSAARADLLGLLSDDRARPPDTGALTPLQAPSTKEPTMPLDAPTPANVLHSDSAGFSADVLASDVPVLVDFWAAWCGPCRALAPHLDTLANHFAGKAKVIKVNADENPDVAARYGVRGLPTLLVFKGGKVVDQLVGNPGSAKPLEQLVQRNL